VIQLVKLACQMCRHDVDLNVPPKKKLVCPECGAINTIITENTSSGPQACGCILPTSFEWKEPDGVIGTPAGDMYVCPDDGQLMSRLDWINEYQCDPKTVWAWMKSRPAKPGYARLGKGIQ
jgi:hypothetical protein